MILMLTILIIVLPVHENPFRPFIISLVRATIILMGAEQAWDV
jgi:hypothetical protein